MKETRRIFGERSDLVLCESAEETLRDADALAVITEWKQFRSPDFDELQQQLADAAVFDGRNLYEPDDVEAAGLRYYGLRSEERTLGHGGVRKWRVTWWRH